MSNSKGTALITGLAYPRHLMFQLQATQRVLTSCREARA